MSWIVLQPSGDYEVRVGAPSYEDLRGSVDGWLEHISIESPTGSGYLGMYLDEEGKIKGLAVNPLATWLAESVLGYVDVIVGPVVLTGPPSPDGEETAISDSDVLVIAKLLDQQKPFMPKLYPTTHTIL